MPVTRLTEWPKSVRPGGPGGEGQKATEDAPSATQAGQAAPTSTEPEYVAPTPKSQKPRAKR